MTLSGFGGYAGKKGWPIWAILLIWGLSSLWVVSHLHCTILSETFVLLRGKMKVVCVSHFPIYTWGGSESFFMRNAIVLLGPFLKGCVEALVVSIQG